MSTADIPHWASRTPAQNAAWDAGRDDEMDDIPLDAVPRYADPVEQACYLAGREEMADELFDSLWNECGA